MQKKLVLGVEGSIRKGGIGQSAPFYTKKEDLSIASVAKAQSSDIMMSQTYYNTWFDSSDAKFEDKIFAEMVGNQSFSLASRFISHSQWGVFFGIYNNSIGGPSLFISNGSEYDIGYGTFKIIVSVGKGVSLKFDSEAQDSYNIYNLVKGEIVPKDNESLSYWTDNGDGTFTSGKTTVAIGDRVNYNYDKVSEGYLLEKAYSGYTSDQTIKQNATWQVLGVNEKGELELIGTTMDATQVYLSGATGYNNGVFLLNDICEKLYSNKKLGVKARSLTIEDIEEGFSEDGKKARDSYQGEITKYKGTRTFEGAKRKYPTLYAEEAGSGVTGSIRDGGIGQSEPFYTKKEDLSIAYNESGTAVTTSEADASEKLTGTQTEYLLTMEDSHFINAKFANLIRGAGNYWVASRTVNCYWGYGEFGLTRIWGTKFVHGAIYDSLGYNYTPKDWVRPVVTLGSNITLKKSWFGLGNSWNLKQVN